MKKIYLFLLIFLLSACQSAQRTEAVYQRISTEDAMKMMSEGKDITILDVRSAEEFASGHIPNAINIAHDFIEEGMKELPNKEGIILVYCRSGARSKKASEKLISLGYTQVFDFGSIQNWHGEIVK